MNVPGTLGASVQLSARPSCASESKVAMAERVMFLLNSMIAVMITSVESECSMKVVGLIEGHHDCHSYTTRVFEY
jgi:hypothetical protein